MLLLMLPRVPVNTIPFDYEGPWWTETVTSNSTETLTQATELAYEISHYSCLNMLMWLPKMEVREILNEGTWFQPGWTLAYEFPENLFPFHFYWDEKRS